VWGSMSTKTCSLALWLALWHTIYKPEFSLLKLMVKIMTVKTCCCALNVIRKSNLERMIFWFSIRKIYSNGDYPVLSWTQLTVAELLFHDRVRPRGCCWAGALQCLVGRVGWLLRASLAFPAGCLQDAGKMQFMRFPRCVHVSWRNK
jgi:hypothetical protein